MDVVKTISFFVGLRLASFLFFRHNKNEDEEEEEEEDEKEEKKQTFSFCFSPFIFYDHKYRGEKKQQQREKTTRRRQIAVSFIQVKTNRYVRTVSIFVCFFFDKNEMKCAKFVDT